MKRQKPYIVGAGVGAVLAAAFGVSDANAQTTVTMGVSVSLANLVTVQTAQAIAFSGLAIIPGATAAVVWGATPSDSNGIASVTGTGIAASADASAGIINFTRGGPIVITPGSAQVTMACFRAPTGTLTATATQAITVGGALANITYAANGTALCTSASSEPCSLFVMPRISFPVAMGSGACSSGTLSIPLVYS